LALRLYVLQNLYNLSDMATVTEAIDSRAFSEFCGVDSSNQVPDGDTLGRFRNLLIKNELQEKLFGQVVELLQRKGLTTVDKGHGRLEKREYWLTSEIAWIDWKKEWKGLGGIGMVRRTVTKGSETTQEIAYFITSLTKNASLFGRAVRGHWGIESMHWSLDVVLNEDKRIVQKDNGTQNLAVLKRMALNIVRADEGFEKASRPRKRFRASWDSRYLETVLQSL
jgi:predicted transposase YbfD/YdcC